MQHPGFFDIAGPFTVAEVARAVGAEPAAGADLSRPISDVRALAEAGSGHVAFLDNRKYVEQLAGSTAGAVLVRQAFAARVPPTAAALVTAEPYRAFAAALRLFYPDALRSLIAPGQGGVAVHPTARIEDGVDIQPNAVVGAGAEIGRGSVIAAGAVVGYRCRVGRDCYIGPGATVAHTLIGDRVIVHAGARLGQDGFGFAMSSKGHYKVPQIGRVIVQDDVEIGANTTIDRGALKDTVIGEGSKIDNLVQIGHNVVMGRHCVIVAQVGIAGSAELGDFVVMGGQAGVVGHIRVGHGAQIAGAAHAKDDVPPGARMGGTPARPFKQWAREIAAVERLARRGGGDNGGEKD